MRPQILLTPLLSLVHLSHGASHSPYPSSSSSPETALPFNPTPQFHSPMLASHFRTGCSLRSTHAARLHRLADLYPDLTAFAPALKVFYAAQPFAGNFDRTDPHGGRRQLLRLAWEDVPRGVKDWLRREGRRQRVWAVVNEAEEQGEEGERWVFGAPGAVWGALPLWVEGEEGEEECEALLHDLSNFGPDLRNGSVVADMTYRISQDDRTVEFTVEAKKVYLKDGVSVEQLEMAKAEEKAKAEAGNEEEEEVGTGQPQADGDEQIDRQEREKDEL